MTADRQPGVRPADGEYSTYPKHDGTDEEGDGRSASAVEERLREAANKAVAILMNEYVPPRRALLAVDVLTDALADVSATGNSGRLRLARGVMEREDERNIAKAIVILAVSVNQLAIQVEAIATRVAPDCVEIQNATRKLRDSVAGLIPE